MQRYFIADKQMSSKSVEITGEDAGHIARVMRMQAGSEVICVNEQGRAVQVELSLVDKERSEGRILAEIDTTPEMAVRVTVAQGLPKGDKLETIVQKGTELGAYAFLPFTAKRSVVKWDEKKERKKMERLQKIAKEAAEQSHRMKVPEVRAPLTVKQLAENMKNYDVCIICDEEEAKIGEVGRLKKAFERLEKEMTMLIVVGPEGGLSREEVNLFCESGAVACGIGPRIVRTETASLYVLAALSYHLEI
ncbi:16S rRNA (uracil(1498)-N(3))-methyltransferase [Shouchella patagoniensis]|uniref:16S rRNA (uracil(1498)-N(3))-methyltransferase n=1 Tax=Shouchella patagoniensis TaxID=228576 RepID=UPI000995463D|nr:16S rRNA (uracil(1498)-N(3))-methyltransferase [Shouchella patagoniensis]